MNKGVRNTIDNHGKFVSVGMTDSVITVGVHETQWGAMANRVPIPICPGRNNFRRALKWAVANMGVHKEVLE